MKQIKVIPVGGLCNRMRVIASVVQVSKNLNYDKCSVYWNRNKDCYAEFNDLFLPVDKKIAEIVENKSLLYAQPMNENLQIPRILQKLYFRQIIWGFNKNTDGNILKVINKEKDLFLYTCHSVYGHYPIKDLFRPSLKIQKIIDAVLCNFSDHTVGIHIRRTDHIKAIEKSPLSYFYEKIDEEIINDPTSKFYLASDDVSVKKEFQNRYGSRIIIYECELSRVSEQGMQNAVVELFLLSKTCKIIGSAASSYSEIAAEIGGIELSVSD